MRCPPAALLNEDDDLLDALLEVHARETTAGRWRDETAAATAELVHALWRLTLQVNSRRGARIPPPLAIPRPWQPARPAARRMRPGELARILTGAR